MLETLDDLTRSGSSDVSYSSSFFRPFRSVDFSVLVTLVRFSASGNASGF